MPAALIANLLLAQQPLPPPEDKPLVSDNRFLVDEAYNQDSGVVQHISLVERSNRPGEWAYSFTEERPVPRNARHQFSYTVTGVNAGARAGFGDTALNWRYQVVSNARVAEPGVVHSGDASGEPTGWGLIGYLSVEHPFGRRP